MRQPLLQPRARAQDPNTKIAMFESADICDYLEREYALSEVAATSP